jgi:hypothetical protein
MADALGMATQLAGNAVRFSWYSGVNWLLAREAQRLGTRQCYTPQLPVPTRAELMADLLQVKAGARCSSWKRQAAFCAITPDTLAAAKFHVGSLDAIGRTDVAHAARLGVINL